MLKGVLECCKLFLPLYKIIVGNGIKSLFKNFGCLCDYTQHHYRKWIRLKFGALFEWSKIQVKLGLSFVEYKIE